MWRIINIAIGGIIITLGEIYFSKICLKKNIQCNKIASLIIILAAILLHTVSYAYLTGIIKTIIIFLTILLLIKLLYKINFKEACFITFLCMVISMMLEIAGSIIIIKILKMDQTFFYEKYAGGIIGNLSMTIGLILISKVFEEFLQKTMNDSVGTNKKILVFSILTLMCLSFLFYSAFGNLKFNKEFFMALGGIIIFISILFSLIKQTIANNRLTAEYDNLLEFMKTYEKEIEEQRILRHETKNQLLTIKAKISDNEEEHRVIKYIDSILDDKVEVNKEKYAKFQYLPANGLKGLFYYKAAEAEKHNINVSINIAPKIAKSFICNLSTENFKQLGKIIGVYIDNAIEASSQSDTKKLGIEMYFINEKIILIISNTYKGEIDLDKIGTTNYSTKDKKRGHGLLLVKSIISRNNMFREEHSLNKDLYVQKLIINNHKPRTVIKLDN